MSGNIGTASETTKKAVILLSGGLDSATVSAIAKDRGYELYGLSFAYGQRHAHEVRQAAILAEHYQFKKHIIADIDLSIFGGSALTDGTIDVPKNRTQDGSIPVTYVPARNTVFLSYALALAETCGAERIFIGANHIDYSGYPDCRPAYLRAFEDMANLALAACVSGDSRIAIDAPLLEMSKAEIIREGLARDVPYDLTTSCYAPVIEENNAACGVCDACMLRLAGFADAGSVDPVRYARNINKDHA